MSKNKYILTIILILTLGIMLSVIEVSQRACAMAFKEKAYFSNVNIDSIIRDIDLQRIYNHVKFFSSLSRVTGYPGCDESADYIIEVFKNLSKQADFPIKIEVQTYPVLVPIDHGANITILTEGERTIKAYTLWPNYVQTSIIPPEGYIGKLIYVGKGSLSDFNGLNVYGSIVLMDFNSMDNWLNAARLGAKAVIFIDNSIESSYLEAKSKFLQTPIHFPRLYVNAEDGQYLIKLAEEGEHIVKINSKMTYKIVNARNIIAMFNGSEVPNEIIGVCAHYDTWSIVPAIAPGADEATGISSLLELARYYSQNRPRRSIWFIAFSGYWEGLAGERAFVEKYFFSPASESGEIKILNLIGLDFSTDGENVAFMMQGMAYMYGGDLVAYRFENWLAPRLRSLLQELERTTGKPYYTKMTQIAFLAAGWWASVPVPYMLDTEPFTAAHGLGWTIRTNAVFRNSWGTPHSGIDTVNIEALREQINVAQFIIYDLANAPNGILPEDLSYSWSMIKPARVQFGGAAAAGGGWAGYENAGFVTLKGVVKYYNITLSWYSPVPNAIVCTARGIKPHLYPFGIFMTLSNEQGNFTIYGLTLGTTYRAGLQTAGSYWIEAYAINETDGTIDYAPDLGSYGRAFFSVFVVTHHPYEITPVCFKAQSISFYDIVEPTMLNTHTQYDPRFMISESSGVWYSTGYVIQPIEEKTLSEFLMWGAVQIPNEKVAMVFTPGVSKAMILIKSNELLETSLLLLNTSDSYPEGYGFETREDAELHIPFTVFQSAKDLVYVSENRYKIMNCTFIRNLDVEYFLGSAMEHLIKAKNYYDQEIYDKAYDEAIAAWEFAIVAYRKTMLMINDISLTTIAFFAILIPFTYFFERLTFQASGSKRFITIVATFTAFLIVFYFMHPGFKIVSNSSVGLLGIILETLFIIIFSIFSDRIIDIAKETRRQLYGTHFMERGGIGRFVISATYSVQSMRRRRGRTLLVLSTICIVTFSLIALTSITPSQSVRTQDLGYEAPLQGLMIKRGNSLPSECLGTTAVSYVRALSGHGGIVMPRAFYYPQSIPPDFLVRGELKGKEANRSFSAFLGLTPEEVDFISNIIPTSEWIGFSEDDYYSCILLTPIPEGIKLGDVLYYDGLPLVVKGIINSTLISYYRGFDKQLITPLDPQWLTVLTKGMLPEGTVPQYVPLSWSQVVIIPYRLAVDLGGYVSSIYFYHNDTEKLNNIATALAHTLRASVYVAGPEPHVVIGFSSVYQYTFGGIAPILVLLIIGGLNILTTILGAVKERTREIQIYSVVGLSPFDIFIMYFIETAVYASVAIAIGYLAGLATNFILVSNKILPPDFVLNSSSASVLLAIGATLAGTLISVIYPATIASKLVTPSLERKWRIPTKPHGGKWEIPLPFSLRSEAEDEAYAILYYINEYFNFLAVDQGVGFIITEHAVSIKDRSLIATANLSPYDAGISQRIVLTIKPEEDKLEFVLLLHHLTGPSTVWEASSRMCVDAIRKQLLMWRGLRAQEREKYIKMAKESREL